MRYRRDIMRRITLAMTLLAAAVAAAACGPRVKPPPPLPSHPATLPPPATDPSGPHEAAITALVTPFLDAELLRGVVIGVVDHDATEIYGFGSGPNHQPPTGATLFELGTASKIYTSLLLCEAVQRREVTLDTPLADLMPAGVSVPTKDGKVITLLELANEASGLPAVPASAKPDQPDPYADYAEDKLLSDLATARLDSAPGTQLGSSLLGAGVLGYALGRKIGGGYSSALYSHVLAPLDLESTFVVVPPEAKARVATGSTTDLADALPSHWGVLAPAGGVISDVRDQVAVVRAELDASANGVGALRSAMRLTQDAQLDREGDNEGIGLQLDSYGRYWHTGSTAGFHSFIGFDPKTKRGVVILASTALSPLDRMADLLYDVLEGKAASLPPFPTAEQLGPYAGGYDLAGTHLVVSVDGKRIYVAGPGEPRHRLVPLSPNIFWLEELAAVVVFEGDNGAITRLSLLLPNGQRVVGPRS
nr:serine hydrolase domain-containing protein [Kofleriaceae bacterium]